MKIETKKDIGQKQYFLFQNRIESADIYKIQVTIRSNNDHQVNYFLNTRNGIDDELPEIFDTKQELIKNLLETE